MAAVEKKAMLLGIVGFTSRIPTLSPCPDRTSSVLHGL